MIKKLLLFSLFITSLSCGMQKASGWGLNPLSGIGLNTETNETVQIVAKAVTTTGKALSEGLSDSTANITQALNGTSSNITNALVGTTKNLERTITISASEVCRSLNHATGQLTNTANKLIDAGVPALNQNINALMQNGVPARIIIDPTTIKTLCFSTTGAALAMAGIGLILYESFFVEEYSTEAPKPASWSISVKNFMKNRYVLGSASIAAGLCLIAKSTTL